MTVSMPSVMLSGFESLCFLAAILSARRLAFSNSCFRIFARIQASRTAQRYPGSRLDGEVPSLEVFMAFDQATEAATLMRPLQALLRLVVIQGFGHVALQPAQCPKAEELPVMDEWCESMQKLVSRVEARHVPRRRGEPVRTKPREAIVDRSVHLTRREGPRLKGGKLTIDLAHGIRCRAPSERPFLQEPIRDGYSWIKGRRAATNVLDFAFEATQIRRVVISIDADPQRRTVEQVAKELNRV